MIWPPIELDLTGKSPAVVQSNLTYSLLKSHRFSPPGLEVTLRIAVVCVLHHGVNYTEASKEVETKHLGEKNGQVAGDFFHQKEMMFVKVFQVL